MSTAERPNFISVENYLAAEGAAEVRSEYIDGWVRAMAVGDVRHNKIKSNMFIHFGMKLHGQPCQPFDSDMKIRIRMEHSTKSYYPDLSIICDSNPPTDVFQDQPVLLVEVLSNSTRGIDLDETMGAYLNIPSLEAYLIVEQHKPQAVLLRRTDQGFLRETYDGLASQIELPFLGLSLTLSTVYFGIEFPPAHVQESEQSYEVS